MLLNTYPNQSLTALTETLSQFKQLHNGGEPTLVSVSLSVILCQDWRLTRLHHSPQSRLQPCTCNNRNQAGSSLYIFHHFLIS
jgi:hypothetical protein